MAVASGEASNLGYNAFMYCAFADGRAEDGWLPEARSAVNDWLVKKYPRWDVDLSRANSYRASSVDLLESGKHAASLDVQYHETNQGKSLSIRLTELDGRGTHWVTDLLAHDHRGSEDWISLTVTNEHGRFVAVPNLAKNLMSALRLTDGRIRFIDSAQLQSVSDIDDVIDVLVDQERHGLIFVAGTDSSDRSVDHFKADVGKWTRQVYGLAQVVVLDPPATLEFNRRVGAAHAVRPWSIRTYRAAVDISDPSDGVRHRYLTQKTIDNRDVTKLLGIVARSHAASRKLPIEVTRVRRAIRRHTNRQIVEDIRRRSSRQPTLPSLSAPQGEFDLSVEQGRPHPHAYRSPSTRKPVERQSETLFPVQYEQRSLGDEAQEAEQEDGPTAPAGKDHPRQSVEGVLDAGRYRELLEQVELVKAILGLDTINDESLRRVAELATAPAIDTAQLTDSLENDQEQIERLEDERVDLMSALEDEQLERSIAEGKRDELQDKVRWLEQQLRDSGRYGLESQGTPSEFRTTAPASFEELLNEIDDALDAGVVFTGDPSTAIQLEANDAGSACRAAWEAVLALRDYVKVRRAGTFDRGFDQYLKNTPPGCRTVPAGKHAANETAATMRQFGDYRCFPVPAEVSVDERKVMKAHFKLARIGMVSPRMYYLDDVVQTGRVYIGYIGPHLPNLHTN